MKNITLSAEEDLIEAARKEARAQQTTLNQMFRDWLASIVAAKTRLRQAQAGVLLDRLAAEVNAGRKFTREEMNER